MEYVPLPDAHSVRINNEPLLKMNKSCNHFYVQITGEHSLQVEVFLNTIFNAFGLPFSVISRTIVSLRFFSFFDFVFLSFFLSVVAD